MNDRPDQQRRAVAPVVTRGLVLGLSLTLVLGLLLWWEFPPKQFALHAGEVSRVQISAPRPITFDSPSRTRDEQDKAAAAIAEVYDPPDLRVGRTQVERAQRVLNYLDSLRHDPHTSAAQKQELIAQVAELNVIPGTLNAILGLDDKRWTILAREALAALDQVMRTELRPDAVADARLLLPRFMSRELSTDETALASRLVEGFVVANSMPNPDRTADLREEARRSVAPVRISVQQDQAILREGEVISPVAIETLEALGLLQIERDRREVAGLWLFAALLAAIIAYYFAEQPASQWVAWRRIILILVVTGLSVLAAKLMVPSRALQPYLVPMPAAGMMLALIFGTQHSVVVVSCISLLIGQLAGDGRELELTAFTFAGAVVAALSVHRIGSIYTFARAAILVALANTTVIAMFVLLSAMPLTPLELGFRAAAGVLNAVLSVSLALAGYSLVGHYLGIVTPLQLLELARPTHPLLRRLLLNAPGTYHHTLLISNMAERAAEAIGADPLLARVAAYYHDVGKSVQPSAFIENLADHNNPHDELNDPYESARIVIKHVQDGMALAKQYRLPRQIADVIPQHHGTMLVAYFFHKAVEQSVNGDVQEQDFRYPGPRPRSPEAAIIMLADGAEAAVRAARPARLEELEQILKTIFRDRLLSGELDESALHLRDLDKIRQAFVEILQGQFHPRVAYPAPARDALPEPRPGIWIEGPPSVDQDKA